MPEQHNYINNFIQDSAVVLTMYLVDNSNDEL